MRVSKFSAPKRDYAAGGDAAAAAPVEYGARSGSGGPPAQAEFAEDMVPFPTDAFAVGEIVAGEVGGSFPVIAGCDTGNGGEEFWRRRSRGRASRVRSKSWEVRKRGTKSGGNGSLRLRRAAFGHGYHAISYHSVQCWGPRVNWVEAVPAVGDFGEAVAATVEGGKHAGVGARGG